MIGLVLHALIARVHEIVHLIAQIRRLGQADATLTDLAKGLRGKAFDASGV